MTIQPRLVVTGRRPDDTSVVLSDGPVEPITVGAIPGSEFYLLWGTEDGHATVGNKPTEPKILPFFAGTGGTRFLLARYAPESRTPEPAGDPALLAAEVAEKLPGLTDVLEPDGAGMHTTDTLDYAICLEGELHLELDDGAEVRLTPGTCVVQQGTRHNWHNRGDKPALMCFIGIGAAREA
ncbi:cupin domain-containing protein [Streptomyces sp. RS10V-4]|uniref:cupin domain-containing protein n=1 Tax=Streptomyces rhizoryzae TaxID=2932493 RepID=UPI0020054382|nr:cupin domain-containing protein [Streptomyces rhizoryzae]MCK7624989.1 cupin domain-containing protein [Streptomyces rhizoryzae]